VRNYKKLRHSNHTTLKKHFFLKKQKANYKLPASAVAHTTGKVRMELLTSAAVSAKHFATQKN